MMKALAKIVADMRERWPGERVVAAVCRQPQSLTIAVRTPSQVCALPAGICSGTVIVQFHRTYSLITCDVLRGRLGYWEPHLEELEKEVRELLST